MPPATAAAMTAALGSTMLQVSKMLRCFVDEFTGEWVDVCDTAWHKTAARLHGIMSLRAVLSKKWLSRTGKLVQQDWHQGLKWLT